jgi:trigger factor
MSDTKNYEIKNKEEKGAQLTLEVSVSKDHLAKFRDAAIKNLSTDVEVKGFRKGKAPESAVIEKIGEMKILEEQAWQVMHELIPNIVMDEKIEALTSPQISVTKIAPGEDLEFKATFALMPKIELADYKKLAKTVDPIDESKTKATEKEITEYIDYLRKNKLQGELIKKQTGGSADGKIDEKEIEELKKQIEDPKNLPELDDEFVKTLGDFKDVADFKNKLTENMSKDKEIKERNRRRTEIIEKVISESKIDLPDVIIDQEKGRMLEQYRHDIERMGMKFEDYIKEIKKTEEDLMKEWHTDAVKRAKMNLILPEIAKAEEIKPDEKRVEHEIKHLKEHHKDIDENHARNYVTHVLTNESVFEFLESQK